MTGDANLLMEAKDKRDPEVGPAHARDVSPRAYRPDHSS